MNKYKKLAVSVVSLVMAGGMTLSFAACDNTDTPDDSNKPVTPGEITDVKEVNADYSDADATSAGADKVKDFKVPTASTTPSQTKLTPKTNGEGKLETSSSVTLKMDIGDDAKRGVAYTSDMISGKVTLVDGKQYTGSSLKPAWAALSQKLGFGVEYAFGAKNAKFDFYDKSSGGIGSIDLFTDTVAAIVSEGLENKDTFLDLSLYMDYMPNYKAFLNANQASYMSIVSDTATGAMYYAPYYDGNDDVEKYVLTKTNWVTSLLDSTTTTDTTTFKAQADAKGVTGDTSSVKSFMGTKGSWKVKTTTSDGKSTTNLVVSYDAALAAAKDESKPLGAALKAAGVTDLSKLTSGNIVDLQNAAIQVTRGTVTGGQLLAILQAYVDVAYQKEDGSKFYAKRSNLFNGYDAGWDADVMTALYRCVVTNPSLLKSGKAGNTIGGTDATPLNQLYGLMAREGHMQRQSDVYSFAGELYGVRGLESRFEFTYIDENGVLQDARTQSATYNAMDKLHDLVKEGLLNVGIKNVGASQSSYYSTNEDGATAEALMIHDYVNTQTPTGFEVDGVVEKGTYAIEDGYYFTPIVTPVSKWNTGADKAAVMRFTESWRSVKNSGFAIPYDAVKNSPEKLSAVLMFIDYLFSEDGQLAMTYGPKSENKTGLNGIWYNEEATAAQVAAGTYFEYEGKKYYSETFYAGKYQPTLTDNAMNAYLGQEVNGIKYDGTSSGWLKDAKCVRSYTNYARYVVGSALAVGNKLQSFEYQCTSDMGKYGASVVDTCVNNGTIKHPYVNISDIKKENKSLWYLISPSAVAYTQAEAKFVNDNASALNKTIFTGEKVATNYLWAIAVNGFDTKIKVGDASIGANALACRNNLNGFNLSTYVEYKQNGFRRLVEYFDFATLAKA